MSFYLHRETGNHYVIIGRAKRESDQEPMIVYRKINTNEKWVRPEAEFFDGRFIKQDLFKALDEVEV